MISTPRGRSKLDRSWNDCSFGRLKILEGLCKVRRVESSERSGVFICALDSGVQDDS